MGGKTQKQESQSSQSYTPAGLSGLQDIWSRIQSVASQPYQPYTGQMVAGLTPTQQTGISNINSAYGTAQPYIDQAANYAQQGAASISPTQIQGYLNPYNQSVIDATQNQFNLQNAQQQAALKGNTIAQGALGGNRAGVAQAQLAGQQQTAQAPVIAQLNAQNYNQALAAAQADRAAQSQAAYTYGNLGTTAQNAALQGAQAQIGAGGLEQQTQQNQLNAAYQQYLQGQAFPYQQAQFLASLGIPTLGSMGGSQSGTQTTTSPGPSPWAQAIGLGISALGAYSDKRVKENVEKVGKEPDGLGVYDFSYVWDPNSRHRGYMAQEVEKKYPEAVGSVNGIKTVNYDEVRQKRGYADGGSVIGGLPYSMTDILSYIPKTSAIQAAPSPNFSPMPGGGGGSGPASFGTPSASDLKGMTAGFKKLGFGQSDPLSLSPFGAYGSPGGIGDFSGTGLGTMGGTGLPGFGGLYAKGGAVDNDFLGSVRSIRKALKDGYANGGVIDTVQDDSGTYIPTNDSPYAGAISSIESGGNYGALGPYTKGGDRAYGRYQIMGSNVGPWTNAVLGQSMTPDQFLRDKAAQDAVFNAKFGSYVDKYGPEGAAKAWFAGEGGMNNPNARDVLGTTVSDYANKFRTALGQSDDTSSQPMALGFSPEGQSPYPLAMQSGQQPQAAPNDKQSGTFGGFNPLNLSDEARQGLIAAGLGMAASRSPFVGTAIGEGGLQGLQAYSQAKKTAAEHGLAKQRVDLQAQNLARQAEQFSKTFGLNEKRYDLDEKKFAETQRHNNMALRNPVKIGQNKDGVDIYAMPKAAPDGSVEYYLIDPSSGQVSTSPMGKSISDGERQNQLQDKDSGFQQAAYKEMGLVRANDKLVQSGPYDYSRNAPIIEKGLDLPEPQETAGRSSNAVKTDAEFYLQTGKLPPVRGGRSPVAVQQNNYRNAVQNYGNALAQSRGVTPEQLADMWRTAPGMLRFVLGADGRSTVSLGTAVRHLDTVQELAKAWAANDVQTINKLRALVSREFGNDAATNLQVAGKIVGPEIIKAIGVAGAGTAEERLAAERAFSTASSPEQLLGAVQTTQKLLGGQLEGRKRQAMNAGVSEERFRNLIGDRPYEILSALEKRGHGEAAPAPAGAQMPKPSQADIDYAKAHPEVRQKFMQRFGREP